MICTQPGCGERDGLPGLAEGFCRNCGIRFSFSLSLEPVERSYRALTRLTPDEDRRIELVDMANAIRPRTLT
jgi:protein kinase G-like protein